jgi:tetratricopeptide (TPR) repeat protein
MGWLGKLFGGGPRRPPSWAGGFGDDGARFDRFAGVVTKVLADADARGDVRSGSVMIVEGPYREREWILYQVAARCARTDESEWESLVRADLGLRGGAVESGEDEAAAAPGAWIIGTSAWGGVLLQCGTNEMMLVLLPIRDAEPMPPMPAGLIHAIVVCNTGSDGQLAASAVARAAGLDRVYAIDPARPVDRGSATSVKVEATPAELRRGPLTLSVTEGAVRARWEDGTTALVGDAISLSLAVRYAPHHLLGMIQGPLDAAQLMELAMAPPRIVLLANLPGSDANTLATALSQLGIASSIVNQKTSRRLQVLAHLLDGDLARADALAAEAIAAGEEVADLRHQRAMIALMRGDEPAAEALLAEVDTPQAATSRALLMARRREPAAKALIRRALEALPENAITIRGAIQVHAMCDDLDGARALLASHGAKLDGEIRAALARALEDPSLRTYWSAAHRFPEHAQLALDAVKPMIDGGRFAAAEPILRRAAGWDPDNVAIVAELGYTLSQDKRDDDAIALYDEAIARGGSAVLLRFNRGNCRLRTARFSQAAEDFRACLQLKPDWHEARVSLVSSLFAGGDAKGARAELERLKSSGGAAQHVAALEKMLAGTL